MDVWVLVATKTDRTDPDDTGVCAVFGSLDTGKAGAEAYVDTILDEPHRFEWGDTTALGAWRLYVMAPGRPVIVFRLERHDLDAYGTEGGM